MAGGIANDDLDVTYRGLPSVDMSREVFSRQPHRLLAFRDTESGWADLGSPKRVLDTLALNGIEPGWLSAFSSHNGALQLRDEQPAVSQ